MLGSNVEAGAAINGRVIFLLNVHLRSSVPISGTPFARVTVDDVANRRFRLQNASGDGVVAAVAVVASPEVSVVTRPLVLCVRCWASKPNLVLRVPIAIVCLCRRRVRYVRRLLGRGWTNGSCCAV